jgi:hypothetical protein
MTTPLQFLAVPVDEELRENMTSRAPNIAPPEPEVQLTQFNRLVQELLRGKIQRNTFQPWEIEVLLDIESCQLRDSNRREVLRRYQKAANRQFEKGSHDLMKLSEYLEKNRRAAAERRAAKAD